MPETQAYSVDWTVTIQPEGDVSKDVNEIVIVEEEGIDSATVKLDTSERPHALEEQRDISISLTDGNTTREFNGLTDSIQDDDTRPLVTIDAREPEGAMQDATAVGVVDADNLFRVIDAILDNSPGKVREISFDPSSLEDEYSTFAGSTQFGYITVAHSSAYPSGDSVDIRETSNQGKEVELRIRDYNNNTGSTFTMDLTGLDADGNTVTASVDLPPGSDAQTAFGTDSFKLALSGGNQRWTEVTGITTDIPTLGSSAEVILQGYLWNYVKTKWDFKLDDLISVHEAVGRVVQYISGLDDARSWEYYVDASNNELVLQPESASNPERWIWREGDNVMKPVASRDLDGVRNMIKVIGADDLNVWTWAYGGSFFYAIRNPFDTGTYPDSGVEFAESPGDGHNDIDRINARGQRLRSDTFTSYYQAREIAKEALRQYYRTPVSGQAPISGLHPAIPGDEAEIYYPSRGIPQKVASNVYTVKKVETRVTSEEAKTTVDFGIARPNLADQIAAGPHMIRTDIDQNIMQFTEDEEDTFPLVGELSSQNDDGTWQVDGDDGQTYENVRVI